ncbi:CatB-related O-acetyltransferase [Mangrovimonas sp. TPBH4]|uniref:CatB-related O-acetyltransferase n=1 Tax=Mangrovimonas sp. TPBH4 TaxID=1645914 RepID=UPI000B2D37B0|nr:CatB-related O-acetyltransferase [Mangrovimonas sp. TPBH4]
MELAPIILFVYNRLNHTKQTIEALKRNDLASESELFIYADFPKTETHLEEVDKVREYIKKITGFKKITIVERISNWGLANNIIDGVSSIVNKYGKIIVLEDDIVTSKGFLRFMNQSLETYKNEKSIAQINGYVYPHQATGEDLLYLRVLACWGWATWKDRWEEYNHDITKAFTFLNSQNKIDEFNILGDADYYTQLQNNKSNVIYTWAVRWYASWFINGKISVFPPVALVQNIGDDDTGEHSKASNNVFRGKTVDYVSVPNTFNIKESLIEKRRINNFYKTQVKKNKVKKEHLISKGLRSLLFRFLPETRVLFDKNINWKLLRNTTYDFNIASTAKVNTPYYIVDSTIEDYSYVSTNAHIDKAKIGKFCSIGPNLICGWGIHPTNGISTHPMFYSTAKQNGNTFCNKDKIQERKRISIGNDVFIGANVTILDGVSIGDGAVIGAGAVVSKDIPPYAIAVGNPIKVIKYRFEQDVIDKLLKIKWWEKGISQFKEVEEMFFNVDEYVNKYT